MRLHWNHWTTFFFFFFFATTTLCAAQEENNNNNSTQEENAQAKLQRALALVQQMPSCAQTCLVQAVAASGATAGNIDIAASCTNTTATAGIEECATTTCTLREQLKAKNLTETLCERPPHSAPTYSIASIVGGGFVLVAYFMRVASKIYFPCQKGARIDNDFWWDDATITIAFLLIIPITALSNVLTQLGIGRDVWTLTPENIEKALKMYYVDEILYMLVMPIIKIAILCTYLRIFTNIKFKRLVYGTIGLNVAYAIAFSLITIFQCTPVKNAWENWDKSRPGRCNNINAQSWASAGWNIVLDLVVVILPMPMLWRMNLNPRKKFLVMLMFGVGFFVTFVSILRLRLLVKFGESKNISYDYKQFGYWTVIEIDTALVCACMPGIRNLIRRAFPRLMGQSMGGTSALGTPIHGLSGRTVVGSGVDKNGTEVFVRPRHSDDGNFIPLENVSERCLNQMGQQHERRLQRHDSDAGEEGDDVGHGEAVVDRSMNHARNFSRPVSPPESAWQEWNGEKGGRVVPHSPA